MNYDQIDGKTPPPPAPKPPGKGKPLDSHPDGDRVGASIRSPIAVRRAIGERRQATGDTTMARRLLLVEDSSTMRRMISAMLQDEGYEVATAVDGLEGWPRRGVAPELILTDYEMPELDGPGLCRALKADEELRPIPVLMLTTLGATESKVIGLDAGADDYMQKPRPPRRSRRSSPASAPSSGSPTCAASWPSGTALLEAAQAKLDAGAEPRPQGPARPDAPAPQAPGGDPPGRPLQPGQPAGRRRVRLRPAGRRPAGHPGGRHLGARGELGLALGDGQDPGRPADRRRASPGGSWPGWTWRSSSISPRGIFCTGFYLRIDEKTGAFDYAGVGHPPAIVVGPGRDAAARFRPGPAGDRHGR